MEEKIDRRCANCKLHWAESIHTTRCPSYGRTTLNGECNKWEYREGASKQFNDEIGRALRGEEKFMDNAVEIVKKKSDLMNMLRSDLKNYGIEADNGELSSLINAKKGDINHALTDRLAEIVREIAKEFKEGKRIEIKEKADCFICGKETDGFLCSVQSKYICKKCWADCESTVSMYCQSECKKNYF